jgi:hypothetical protein
MSALTHASGPLNEGSLSAVQPGPLLRRIQANLETSFRSVLRLLFQNKAVVYLK